MGARAAVRVLQVFHGLLLPGGVGGEDEVGYQEPARIRGEHVGGECCRALWGCSWRELGRGARLRNPLGKIMGGSGGRARELANVSLGASGGEGS